MDHFFFTGDRIHLHFFTFHNKQDAFLSFKQGNISAMRDKAMELSDAFKNEIVCVQSHVSGQVICVAYAY